VSRPERRDADGLTLVELLIVVVVIALLATAAVPSVRQGPADRLDLVERQLVNAVSYARYLSEATAQTHALIVDPTNDGFAVLDGSGQPVTDPLTKRGYVITFDGPGQPQDIDFTAVDFGSSGRAAIFGPDGLPDDSGTITIECRGEVRTLVLNSTTGNLVRS
jgi:prepilin-type N-terminal cleavage/methylation domain-containing protein